MGPAYHVERRWWVLIAVVAAAAVAYGYALGSVARPGLAVVPPLAALGFVAGLRAPGVVFAAYLYIPFYKGLIDPISPVDITPLLAGMCFLLCIPVFLRNFHQFPRMTLTVWALLLAVVLLGVSYAPAQDLAIGQALNFVLLVFLPGLLAILVAREENLREQFLYGTAVLSTLVVVAGFVQLVGAGSGTAGRLTALGANTIGTARAALLLPLLAPFLLPRVPMLMRLPAVIAMLGATLVAVSTGSRGPLLMGGIAFLVVLLAGRGSAGKRVLYFAAGAIGTFAFFQVPQLQRLLPESAVWRIETMVNAVTGTGTVDASTRTRVELFDLAARMFQERPLVGYGTAGYEAVAREWPGMYGVTYPHNIVLQFAAEYGLLGLSVLAALIIVAFGRGFRAPKSPEVVCLVALAAFALLNAMVSNGFVDNRWLWGMLLVLAALPATRTSDAEKAGDSVARLPRKSGEESISSEHVVRA